MNLKEFIRYKTNCPICTNPLITSFHSQKQQSICYEDNRLIVIFRLASIKKKQLNYKVGYSFGLENNSWHAEFYTDNNVRFENDCPNFLRDRFKELDKNLKQYKFYRHCTGCNCYNYSSNSFNLDYKSASIADLSINVEYAGMYQQVDSGDFKVYRLLNDYNKGKSTLMYGRHSSKLIVESTVSIYSLFGLSELQTSLIKISTNAEMMDRLTKLLIFS